MATDDSGSDWQLVHFIECLPEALLVASMDGRIQLVNSHLAELFGYARDELAGLSVESLIPGRLRERHEALRHAFASTPHDRPMGAGVDIVGRRKDGSEFSADVELRVRDTPHGKAVLAVVRDLSSARDDREGELLRTHAQRTRELHRLVLSTGVALDDWAELLSLIRSAALRLATTLPDGADGRGDAEAILRAADGAADVLDRLREQVARQTASAAGIGSEPPSEA